MRTASVFVRQAAIGIVAPIFLILTAAVCGAQESTQPPAAPQANAETSAETTADSATKPADLTTEQETIGKRFAELEKVMLRMAELTASTDPRRAALLRQAVARSKDREIDGQFGKLVELLKQDRLSPAVKGQAEVQDDLNQILDLLLSEDRGQRIESEKEKIREYIKRVNKLIKAQKGVQGGTAGQGDAKELSTEQAELAKKTGEVADDLKKDDGHDGKSDKPVGAEEQGKQKSDGDQGEGNESTPGQGGDKSDEQKSGDNNPGNESDGADKPKAGDQSPKSDQQKSGEQKPSDQKSGDKPKSPGDKSQNNDKPGENQKSEKPSESNEKPSESQPSDSQQKPGDSQSQPNDGDQKSQPQKSQPQQSQPQQGQPQQNQPQQGDSESQQQDSQQSPAQQNDESPTRRRLEQARKNMDEAKKKLDEAKRDEAVDEQQQALENLHQAIAELERILRQLREEEMTRTLAQLEARFRKMLDVENDIYDGTKRLDKIPMDERDRDHEVEAGRLSRKQAENVGEADRALAILQEEGSAVALPEAVGDMRDDMEEIVVRLAQMKVGELTQSTEADVIAALEEIVGTIEEAQKDLEQKKQQPMQPMQPGEPEDQPLVDQIAELKMIRALQLRVNKRTQRYAEMTETEQAEKPDLIKALQRLAERERRVHKVTRDIVVGRNQ